VHQIDEFNIKGLVHPKMKILSVFTRPHVVPNPVRPSFIFGTQIKIFKILRSLLHTVHRLLEGMTLDGIEKSLKTSLK